MKVSLKLANGATLEFEGDEDEFERVSAFLGDPPDSLTAGRVGNDDSSEDGADRHTHHSWLASGSCECCCPA